MKLAHFGKTGSHLIPVGNLKNSFSLNFIFKTKSGIPYFEHFTV